MKFLRYKYLSKLLLLIVTFSVIGCVKDELNHTTPTAESVECNINLSIATMSSGTEQSRASVYPTTFDEFTVENLWVVQFDANDIVLCNPIYIEDYNPSSTVKLITPSDKGGKLLFIANSFDKSLPIFKKMRLEEVYLLSRYVRTADECYNMNSKGEIRIMTSGIVEIEKSDFMGTVANLPECKLESGVAKIAVKFENQTSLTIKNLQMKGVCNKLYYAYPERSKNSNYPDIENFEPISYKSVSYDSTKDLYIFYVPTNRRGSFTNDKRLQSFKPHFATTDCTYLNVTTLNGNQNINYNFYLGADLIEDFNLSQHTQYNYDLKFNTTGNEESDLRIDNFGDYDFTIYPSANCYILNPSEICDRKFTIPVEERINNFWTNYETKESNLLDSEGAWTCELIWSDAASLSNGETEISFAKSATNSGAMEVVLPKGFNHGNFVVGVKNPNGSDYLWSWHLWVTDYNPCEVAKAIDDKAYSYLYGVTGGEVHKYSNDGEVQGGEVCYIMDRTIGARSIRYPVCNEGALYYQFGRKDPFALTQVPKIGEYIKWTNSTAKLTMAESVNKPYIYSLCNPNSDVDINGWEGGSNSDDTYKSSNNIWFDKNAKKGEGKKSIFDPSPLGWRVPEINVYMRMSNSADINSKNYRMVYFEDMQTALFLNGEESVTKSNYLAAFPVNLRIDEKTGKEDKIDKRTFYWLSIPYEVSGGTAQDAGKSSLAFTGCSSIDKIYFTTAYSARASGRQIRPVYYSADLVPIK